MPPRERLANSPVGFCSEQPAVAGIKGVPDQRKGGGHRNHLPIQLFYSMSLPKEIIERITAGVDLGYHLIKVTAKLVDTYFLSS